MATQQILLGVGGVSTVEVNASSTTNVVLATVFGSDWSSSADKIYNVPSGVTIGGTGSAAAIVVSSGMSGTLVINVSGTVIAKGGSRGSAATGSTSSSTSSGGDGGAGRDAISVASSGVTINNLSGGQISGGGGGGGGGGAGGRGQGGFFLFAGGNGGIGGYGAGYNQSATNGAGGSAGGSNKAGVGGSGGNGGSLGNAGSSGSSGTNGQGSAGTNGGGGGDGGAAGKAISNAGASWTNGTTSGTYHGSYT